MARPGNADALRLKIRLADASVAPVVAAFWSHPELRRLFPEYLFAVHSCIRASTPLMRAALERARESARTDPVANGLARYLDRHVHDEDGHDTWLLEDMEALGLRRDEILARVPSHRAACMVGSQYYWIHHVHPIAILGYIAVLEGQPPAVAELRDIREGTGLPAAAFRTLLEHAELDVDHAQELYDVIDALPLTAAHSGLVGTSALQTLEHMGGMFQDLLRAAGASAPAGLGT
jgi:pyrroloquinoline quinone (PQQ) biosynthesis protein C